MLSEIRHSLNGNPTFLPSWALLYENMKSILQPFWLNFDSKWKIASPLICLFSFNHYFTTWIILLHGRLNVLVMVFENMVPKCLNKTITPSHHIPYIFCIAIYRVVYLEEHEQTLGLNRKHVPREKRGYLLWVGNKFPSPTCVGFTSTLYVGLVNLWAWCAAIEDE